jgi:hypothetical protein
MNVVRRERGRTGRVPRAIRGLLLLPFLLTCADDSGSGSGTQAGDSSIVESRSPVWDTRNLWQLETQPALDLGVDQGAPAFEFETILGLTRLANGNIVVGNDGTNQLRFFSPEGAFIRAVGNDGEGPGEFRAFNGVFPYRRDSLIVWDYRLKRWTVFDTAGAFVRIISPERPGLNPRSLSPLDDGSLIIADTYVGSNQLGKIDQVRFFRFNPAGRLTDSLGTYPSAERFRPANGDNIVIFRIFGPTLVSVGGPDGFFIGLGADNEVLDFSGRGQLRRTFRWSGGDRKVTRADIDRFRSDFINGLGESEQDRQFARFLPEVPVAELFPAYSHMRRDRVGNLWIAEYRRPHHTGPRSWTVLNSDGRWLGDVNMPDGLHVWDIGDSYVLGVVTDEFDVEHVRMYMIAKGK